jgi:hypothetical protein
MPAITTPFTDPPAPAVPYAGTDRLHRRTAALHRAKVIGADATATIAALAAAAQPHPARIIDVGCGRGSLALRLAQQSVHLEGDGADAEHDTSASDGELLVARLVARVVGDVRGSGCTVRTTRSVPSVWLPEGGSRPSVSSPRARGRCTSGYRA